MSMGNNNLGARGESAVSTCLLKPLGDSGTVQFLPVYLGDKTELLDFLVLLVGPDDRVLGPHFFLQVKTTAGETQEDDPSIAARFTAEEVERVQKFKTPAYIAAVDASKPNREFIYILGISSERKKGIASVPKRLSLNDVQLRESLYQEVMEHFKSRSYVFNTCIN